MAKKLMLELGLDYSEFDAAFANADATAKKRQKTMNETLSKVTKSYEIEINKAKLAGDAQKALALDTERLAVKVDILKRAEENLAKVRNEALKGGNAQQIAAAEKQYQDAIIRRQKMELAYKAQQNGGSNVAGGLKGLIAGSQYGGVLTTITSNADKLNMASSALGVTLGGPVTMGFAAAVAAATAYFKVLTSLSEASEESAKKAAELGEATYKMKERLSLDETTANRLSAVFAIDGTNIDGALKKMEALGAALNTTNEEGTKAEQALNKYGETLKRADGSMKNSEEMLTAIANAYKKAEEAGMGYQLLAETGTGKFSTLIASWDDLIARGEKVEKTFGATTKMFHEMSDRSADLTYATKQLDKQLGSNAASVRIQVLENELKLKNEQIKFQKEHNAELQAYEERIGFITQKLDGFSATWEKIKQTAKAGLGSLIIDADAERLKTKSAADRELEQAQADAEKKAKADAERKNQLEAEKEAATAKANASLEKMVWELKASDYEKELAKIDEVAEAKRKEGADEVRVAEYVATAKQQLNDRINEKMAAENKKREQERINSEKRVLAEWEKAEKQREEAEKRSMEKRKSDAEKALTSQKKLWQAYLKFGDTEQFQQFALNDRLKSLGISKKDYASMDATKLAGFTSAMDKFQSNTWFSQLGKGASNPTVNNVTNNNTVTIDRPVLTDESLINQLVDRVSEKMVAVAEKAFGNRAQNTFG